MEGCAKTCESRRIDRFLGWGSRVWPYMWFVWVAVLSLLPSWKREFHTKGPLHVPGHALIFAVSAVVACRSAQSVFQRVIRCAAVIGFGCGLEALQSWIFRSRFEWDDVVTDACGVLLFLLVTTVVDSMRKNRYPTPEPGDDLVTKVAGFSQRQPDLSLAAKSRREAGGAVERRTGAHDPVL